MQSTAISYDEDLIYIKKGKGVVLLNNGYQYHKKVQFKNQSWLWRCCSYKRSKCSGSVTLQNGIIMKRKLHSCIQDFTKNIINLELSECKEKILSSEYTPVLSVYKEFVGSLQDFGIDLIKEIPPFSKLKSGLYKSQNVKFGVNKNCSRTGCEVEIPEKYKYFALAHYRCYDDGLRIIIFCSQRGKEQLHQVKYCFGDGTFKCCPKPFSQLYTIHGDIGSSNKFTNKTPLVYVLMNERTENAYSILIQMLKSQIPEFCPTKFMTDFEFPAINAIKTELPDITLKGCLYYYKNSLRRKGKAIGLLKNKFTKRIVNLCAALSLLPKDLIIDGWNYVFFNLFIMGLLLARI